MEIVTIEKQAFNMLIKTLESLFEAINEIDARCNKKMSKWLDNAEVCQLLNISKRTLQTYRDNGTLPYSQIRHKIFYKTADVEKLLKRLTEKNN